MLQHCGGQVWNSSGFVAGSGFAHCLVSTGNIGNFDFMKSHVCKITEKRSKTLIKP